MRKYSFKGILLSFFLLLFLFSCETEEALVLDTAQEQKQPEVLKGNTVDVLSADDIPQVIDRITSITNANKTTLGNKVNEEGYFLDTNRILGVTDSVGNKTYALKLYLKNGRENAFYNLIATERSYGQDIPVAILEYIMEPDYFIDRSQGIKRAGGYERTINYYSFRDFSYISLASTGEYHTLPDPCGEFSMDGDGDGSSGTSSGSGGGGSGGGPGSSSGTGGTSYTGGTGPIGVSSGGSTGGGATPDVEVGEGCFCDSFEPSGGDAEKLGGLLTGKDDDCPEGEILLPVNEEEEEDVLLIPSCQSFEYANGLLVKAAGVSNIQNIFVAAGFYSDGSPYYHRFDLNITEAYFSMPKTWTNGNAANYTANALHLANLKTKAWFQENPKVSVYSLGLEWDKNIRDAMRAIGGDYSKTAPFPIKNLAPYAEDWVWAKTDCTK